MYRIYPAAYLARTVQILVERATGQPAGTRVKLITVHAPHIAETIGRDTGRTVGDTDFTATGLAVRSETVITASATGTPCYYIRDGEKVSKGANIYAIDSSGSMQAAMSDMQENGSALLTSADYTSLNNQIKMFKNGFSASNFGNVYNFYVQCKETGTDCITVFTYYEESCNCRELLMREGLH